MDYSLIFDKLEQNGDVFRSLLSDVTPEEARWKVASDKWCLLEIICHLCDEEREDFRTRLRNALETPDQNPPGIDPPGWVTERNYIGQDFQEKLSLFLEERTASVAWLRSLQNPRWDNVWQHPSLGPQSGHFFISNWLAHDYLHIRQITRLKYDYLMSISGESLAYAGNWI